MEGLIEAVAGGWLGVMKVAEDDFGVVGEV